jgi:hypothetical protein
MDLLETQANDLRYLTQARLPPAPSRTSSTASLGQNSPTAALGEVPGYASEGRPLPKRKTTEEDDLSGKQQRSKRSRVSKLLVNSLRGVS